MNISLSAADALVAIVLLGIVAQWVAWRSRLPAIVLLAAIGLIIGPIFNIVSPAELLGAHLQPLIGLCVAIILFEGGLDLRLHELREAGKAVRRLTSIGVVLAWVAGSAAAHYIAGLTWGIAILLGAILVVTGPTVIIPLLRQAQLNKKVASVLKWEGIINDPIGVLLAVLVFQYLVYSGPGQPLTAVLMSLGIGIVVALVIGGGSGYLLGRLFLSGKIPEYLKAPSLIAAVLAVFRLSDLAFHEAGLLAVTVMGMVMGNMDLRSISEMRRFKEYLTILLVSTVFILLTANLPLAVFVHFDWHWAAFIALLMFVVRPIVIWISTIGTGLTWKERILIGWIAPRGIVAAAAAGVFSIPLVEAGYTDAAFLPPIVFSVIFATIILHGFSARWLASKLGLTHQGKPGLLIIGGSSWNTSLAEALKKAAVPTLIADTSWHLLRRARMSGIPVFYGEILSEKAEESLELTGMHTLLAASNNDAYNSLVCTSLAPEFGRSHVFQLPNGSELEQEKQVARQSRGVLALPAHWSYGDLWNCEQQGWRFSIKKLTDSYGIQQAKDDLPEQAIIVLLLSESGAIQPWRDGLGKQAQVNDMLVVYAPPEPVITPDKTTL